MGADAGWRAFWRFSLGLWRRPGVEAACLWLQERWGADVNLLLLCCWLEREGRRADGRLLRRAASAVAPWRTGAVLPLRRLRRRLRRGLPGVSAAEAEAVRGAAGTAELLAEQVEQRLLGRCAVRHRPRAARRIGPDGLERYRLLLGAPGEAEGLRHLASLREATARGGRRPARDGR